MDKFIESLLDEFEEAQNSHIPERDYINSYANKLPKKLLDFWHEFGFCSFLDGMLWIVDPNSFKDTLDKWIEQTPSILKTESYHVIAKSGFGDLYIYSENSGYCFKLNAMNGWLIKQEINTIDYFFSSLCPYTLDLEDIETDEEMFEAAVDKFGKLDEDEIFGFVPALVAGGKMVFENLQKVNMQMHLDLILQFKEPKVITLDDLTNMAFS